jgi:hypothetical protein
MRASRVAILTLVACVATPMVAPARADDAAGCVSYADNVAKARADAGASNRYFFGEYARAFFARFAAIIGGAPDGVAGVTSVSAHIYSSGGAQAVDVRFYGANGCDLGPGATLAIFLFSEIVQEIGSGA